MGRISREIRYCDTERFKYRGEKRLSKPRPRPSHRLKSTPPVHLANFASCAYGIGNVSSEEGVQNPGLGLGLGHGKERLYPHLFKTESERQAGVVVKDLSHKRAGSSYQVSSDSYNLTSLVQKQPDGVTSHDVTKTPVDSQNSFDLTDKHDLLDTEQLTVNERQNALETLPSEQFDKHVGDHDGTSGVLVRMYDRYSEEQGTQRQDQRDVTEEVVSGNVADVELHAERETSTVVDTSEEFLQYLVKGIVKEALDGALVSYSVGPGFRNCYIDSISTKICTDAMAKVRKYIYRNDTCSEGWDELESTAATLVLNAMKHALDIKNRCEYIVHDKNKEGRDESSDEITQPSHTECLYPDAESSDEITQPSHTECLYPDAESSDEITLPSQTECLYPDADTVNLIGRKKNDVSGSVDDLVGMAVYMLLI